MSTNEIGEKIYYSDAISGENKYRKLKKSGKIKSSAISNPSETIRLKLMLDDYEKLKSMKDELLNAKSK